MSLRRPKIQVKPKLAVRSLVPKVVTTSDAIKSSNDLNPKTVESSAKELVKSNEQLTNCVDNCEIRLTTSVTQEISESNDTNVDSNNTTDQTKRDDLNGRTEQMVVEVSHQSNDVKETNVLETDSKQQKNFDNKSKPKTERKRKICRNSQKSDKSVMRMKDLLLYNPPMTDEQKEMREKDTNPSEMAENLSEVNQNKCETENTDSNEGNAGPRVKVGTDGLLILDEESVVVKRQKPQLFNAIEPILESAGTTSALTNYSSFRNRTKGSSKPRWTEHETIRFYSALNTIGTDFTLMANLFFRGKRTRLDLRNKFKKEERINKLMIDEALFSPNTFINQCPELDDLLDDSTDSDDDSDDQTLSLIQKTTKSKT